MLVQQLHWARTEERDLEDLAIEQEQLVGLDLSHLEYTRVRFHKCRFERCDFPKRLFISRNLTAVIFPTAAFWIRCGTSAGCPGARETA